MSERLSEDDLDHMLSSANHVATVGRTHVPIAVDRVRALVAELRARRAADKADGGEMDEAREWARRVVEIEREQGQSCHEYDFAAKAILALDAQLRSEREAEGLVLSEADRDALRALRTYALASSTFDARPALAVMDRLMRGAGLVLSEEDVVGLTWLRKHLVVTTLPNAIIRGDKLRALAVLDRLLARGVGR